MAKNQSLYICDSCGAEFPKWQGKCPQCGDWNTLQKKKISGKSSTGDIEVSEVKKNLRAFEELDSKFERENTGVYEFDRVLGGGIVPGSISLIVGEPGIGKSTLLLQVADSFAQSEKPVLFVCGEESPEQIKSRAGRLGLKGQGMRLFPETDVDKITALVSNLQNSSQKKLGLVVVDSVQTLTTADLSGGAGSVSQVRECSERLRKIAKQSGIPIFLVGHVTKSGNIAGPKVLEHLVDAVFGLEGDKFHAFRLFRASKNRFGPTFEVGVFAMREKGLEEVDNPSEEFISQRDEESSGSVIVATLEGTRPVLVEVQALAVPSKFKYPRRVSSGFSSGRINLLCAVLEKRGGVSLQDRDLYVNVASGMSISEPAGDLGVVLAVASVLEDVSLSADLCTFGEVGLSGEVREVNAAERRIEEAERLGFENIVSPPEVSSVRQALERVGI